MSIRVLVADDEEMVRTGFGLVLGREGDIDVVAEAADGLDAVAAAERARPDVALMDIRMPGIDGLEATRRIVANARLATRIVILTTFDLDEYVYDALQAGASGFLLKYAPADDLVSAIRVVARGEAMLAPSVTRRLVEEFARQRRDPETAERIGRLSARELEVLRHVARGMSNAEIASELFVTGATVKTHVARLLEKLEVRDRVQAVALAYESGLMRDRS